LDKYDGENKILTEIRFKDTAEAFEGLKRMTRYKSYGWLVEKIKNEDGLVIRGKDMLNEIMKVMELEHWSRQDIEGGMFRGREMKKLENWWRKCRKGKLCVWMKSQSNSSGWKQRLFWERRQLMARKRNQKKIGIL
jgi:hypothetical protein